VIHNGTQELLIKQTTLASGTSSKEGVIQSDSLLCTLWVDSITSGTLNVSVYTLTDTGKEVLLFSFPTLTAPSTELLLKKSGVSMQRFRVVATYTGVCQYEIYARALDGAGESSSRILGANTWDVEQVTVGTGAQVLIPASLQDRNGLVVKNWSSTQTVYLANTLAKADSSKGYPLAPRDALAMDVAAGAEVYVVSDAAGADIRIAQSGG